MGCCPWKSIRPRGDEEEEEGRARGAGGVCRHLGKRKRLNEGWLWEGGQPVMLKRVTWAEFGRRKGSERQRHRLEQVCVEGPQVLLWKGMLLQA